MAGTVGSGDDVFPSGPWGRSKGSVSHIRCMMAPWRNSHRTWASHISVFVFLLSKWGHHRQLALRNKNIAVPRAGPGTQWVPNERQVSSLGLIWPQRKEGPVSHALMRNLDAENKEEV